MAISSLIAIETAGRTSCRSEGFETDFFSFPTKGEASDSLQLECTNNRIRRIGDIPRHRGANQMGLNFHSGAMRSIMSEILVQVAFRTVKALEKTISPSSNDA